tara:strand:- start:212 stop:538 length:327 start_codon:yes stop_codon:yes gene_type:complete
MIPLLFYAFSLYLLIQAFRLMSVGYRAMEQNEKDLNRKPLRHPEMADVKEGDELLVVNFKEVVEDRSRFKLDSPELHNLGDPLNKSLKDRIKELNEEDDGEGDIVVRR